MTKNETIPTPSENTNPANGANDKTREILVAKINPLTTPITDHPAEREFCELVGRVFELVANGVVAPSDTGEIYITDKTIMRPIYQEIKEIEEFTAKKLTRDKLVQAIFEQPAQLEKYEKTIDRLNNRIDELLADNEQRRQKFIDDILGGNNPNFEPVREQNKQLEYLKPLKHNNLTLAHNPVIQQGLAHGLKTGEKLTFGAGKYKTELVVKGDKPILPICYHIFLGVLNLITSNIDTLNLKTDYIELEFTASQLHRAIYNINTEHLKLSDDLRIIYKDQLKILSTTETLIYKLENDPDFEPLLMLDYEADAKLERQTDEPVGVYTLHKLPIFYRDAQQKKLITNYCSQIITRILGKSKITSDGRTGIRITFALNRYEQGKKKEKVRKINFENYLTETLLMPPINKENPLPPLEYRDKPRNTYIQARKREIKALCDVFSRLVVSALPDSKDAQGYDKNDRLQLTGWHFYHNQKKGRKTKRKKPAGIILEYLDDEKKSKKRKK